MDNVIASGINAGLQKIVQRNRFQKYILPFSMIPSFQIVSANIFICIQNEILGLLENLLYSFSRVMILLL